MITIQIAQGQRPPPVAAGGQAEEDEPAPLVLFIRGGLIEREDLTPAGLVLDGQDFLAASTVDLAEGDRFGRFDLEPLLRSQLLLVGGEPNVNRMIGPAVENHQIERSVAVEVRELQQS